MLQRLRNFWDDDRGQATTEYILIMAVVVMVATQLRSTMGKRMKMVADALFKDIDDAVRASGGSDG